MEMLKSVEQRSTDFKLAALVESLDQYLPALLELLLHLLCWLVDVQHKVRREELTDADGFDLIVVIHTCRLHTDEYIVGR